MQFNVCKQHMTVKLHCCVKQVIQIYILKSLLVVNLPLATCRGGMEKLPFDLFCEMTFKGEKNIKENKCE